MVRIRGAVEIVQVTSHASRVGQVVIVIDVTLGALQRRVRSGKREPGAAVIEGSSQPVHC